MKKQIASDDTYNRYASGGPETPFSGSYSDDVFAALADNEVQESKLSIFEIVPDETQPRRILPAIVRAAWNGSPKTYGDVLQKWEQIVQGRVKKFPIKDLLRGKEAVSEYVNDDPIVQAFGKLVDFAANIRDIGLNHPIGVVKRGPAYRIIYGERRYTAYHLLQHYLGDATDEWRSIPAKVATVGEWAIAKAQAAENFQTNPLNAISKARQFAKLLIIARSETEHYDSWHAMVVDCDRPWYAQVANGDIHRIPRGMGAQFEQALGISTAQMRQYRALLKLTDDHEVNDALWMLGDAGDWSENFMRETAQYVDVATIREILGTTKGYTVTAVTVSQTEEALREAIAEAKSKPIEEEIPPKNEWPAYAWVGKQVLVGPDRGFVVSMVKPETVTVRFTSGQLDNLEFDVHIGVLEEAPPSEPVFSSRPAMASPFKNATNPRDKNGVELQIGMLVRSNRGYEGDVESFNGRLVNVNVANNPYMGRGLYGDTLEVIEGVDGEAAGDEGNSGPEKTVYPDVTAWIGKPAMFKGQPVLVITKSDKPGQVIVQSGNLRLHVEASQLSLPPDMSKKASEVYQNSITPPDDTQPDDEQPDDTQQDDKQVDDEPANLVILDSSPYRPLIEALRDVAIAAMAITPMRDMDQVNAAMQTLNQLLMLKRGVKNREDMDVMLHNTYSNLEFLFALVDEAIAEEFTNIMEGHDYE